MRSKTIFFILVVIFISLSSFALADTAQLDFPKAVQIAYDNNPQMIQARQAITGKRGDLITARSLANPQVEAEIGGFKKNEDGQRKAHLDTITLKQSFDPFGVYFLKSKIAQNDVLIKQESLKSLWSQVYVDVRGTYGRIALDKKELELKNNNLKSLRQFFSNVQLRYESGQVLKNHFQRAKIELLKAESDYLQAENNLNINKARMNLLLGRPREIDFEVKDEFKEEALTQDLDSLITLALAQRPDLKMEQVELNSKVNNVRKEQLNRLPSYSLGFQKTNKSYDKDYSAIVEVSIPLWNLNQGEVKKAIAEREAQKAELEAIKNEIAFEVYEAYQDVQLTFKQQNLFKKSLEEANELFRLADLKYKEGKIDFMNYLDQVQASMDSRIQYYQGLYRLSQSVSQLEKSIYSSLRGEEFLK